MIGESGLAGVNRRLELQKAAWQLGAYAAMRAGRRGRRHRLVGELQPQPRLPRPGGEPTSRTLRRVPPVAAAASLEALSAAPQRGARRRRFGQPISGRHAVGDAWGLYQGESVGNAARDAYLRELDGIAACRDSRRASGSVSIEYASEPEKLYVYLKAYLMLGEPKHLDKKHLQSWRTWSGRAPSRPPRGHVAVDAFPEPARYGETLRPIALDPALVAQARSTIRQASIPQIMYGQLKRSYADDSARALRLDMLAGVGVEKVFRRKSGVSLSEPVPSLYTQTVFKEVTGSGMIRAGQAVRRGRLGVGQAACPPQISLKLAAQVTEPLRTGLHPRLGHILNDLEFVPFSTVQQIRRGARDPRRTDLAAARPAEDRRRQHDARGADADGAAPGTRRRSGARITEGARDVLKPAAEDDHGPSTCAAGHDRHRALPADPSAHGRRTRQAPIDAHPGADSQDPSSMLNARSAGRAAPTR